MSLGRYTVHARDLAHELIESLDDKVVEELHAYIAGLARCKWWDWRVKHEETVAAFVSATPSQRARTAAWRDRRLFLTLAGIQHCLEGAALLESIQRLAPGYSYRQMASVAGQAYQDLMGAHIPEWPFDGESPFSD